MLGRWLPSSTMRLAVRLRWRPCSKRARGSSARSTWASFVYRQTRLAGTRAARERVAGLRGNLDVIDPDWQLVEAAAAIKAPGGLSYADAFCVATAMRLDAPIWTGDPEIIELPGDHEVVDLR